MWEQDRRIPLQLFQQMFLNLKMFLWVGIIFTDKGLSYE